MMRGIVILIFPLSLFCQVHFSMLCNGFMYCYLPDNAQQSINARISHRTSKLFSLDQEIYSFLVILCCCISSDVLWLEKLVQVCTFSPSKHAKFLVFYGVCAAIVPVLFHNTTFFLCINFQHVASLIFEYLQETNGLVIQK